MSRLIKTDDDDRLCSASGDTDSSEHCTPQNKPESLIPLSNTLSFMEIDQINACILESVGLGNEMSIGTQTISQQDPVPAQILTFPTENGNNVVQADSSVLETILGTSDMERCVIHLTSEDVLHVQAETLDRRNETFSLSQIKSNIIQCITDRTIDERESSRQVDAVTQTDETLREYIASELNQAVAELSATENIKHATFQCTICDKLYSTLAGIKAHIKTQHTGRRRFQCGVCDKMFVHQSVLRKHIITHTGEKSFKCKLCDRSFSLSSSLYRHARSHTGENRYKCNLCEKLFTQKSVLHRHIKRTHKSTKAFGCSLCDKMFSDKRLLYVHKQVHKVDKEHKCNACANVFSSRKDLIMHKKSQCDTQHETQRKNSHCTKTSSIVNVEDSNSYQNCSNTECNLESASEEMHEALTDVTEVEEIISQENETMQECTATLTTDSETVLSQAAAQNNDIIIFEDNLNDNQAAATSIVSNLGTDKFCCNICSKTFRHKSVLIKHSRKHSGEKPFKCTRCDMAFTVSSSLFRHVRNHSGQKPHICDLCGKKFAQKIVLQRHVLRHNADKKYQCSVCQRKFLFQYYLNAHMRTHTGGNALSCDDCGKNFVCTSSFDRHALSHSGKRLHVCGDCGKSFSQKCHLGAHRRIHTGEKPYQCDVCDKKFVESGHLDRHKLQHSGYRPFKCDSCAKSFIQKRHYEAHLKSKSHKGESSKIGVNQKISIVSDDCGLEGDRMVIDTSGLIVSAENAKNTSDMKATQTGMEKLECNVCRKVFADSSNISRHMRSHTGQRPYKCHLCEKAFTQKSHLVSHLKIHTGKKTHECDLCGKFFYESSQLKRHQRSHPAIKPYQCALCSKVFAQKSSAVKHMKVHAGNQ